MQDMLNQRKRGDAAFRDKDFKTAIDCYTQVRLGMRAWSPMIVCWLPCVLPVMFCLFQSGGH